MPKATWSGQHGEAREVEPCGRDLSTCAGSLRSRARATKRFEGGHRTAIGGTFVSVVSSASELTLPAEHRELTDLGRESTLSLGARLRSLYVDKLHFLPATLPDVPIETSLVNFRSTGMPRTIETLHQLAEGLFPEEKRDGPIDYVVRNPTDER